MLPEANTSPAPWAKSTLRWGQEKKCTTRKKCIKRSQVSKKCTTRKKCINRSSVSKKPAIFVGLWRQKHNFHKEEFSVKPQDHGSIPRPPSTFKISHFCSSRTTDILNIFVKMFYSRNFVSKKKASCLQVLITSSTCSARCSRTRCNILPIL